MQGAIELLEARRACLVEYHNEFALIKEELHASEQYLLRLDKQLAGLDVMQTNYRSLPEWRKQHQEENACHEENILCSDTLENWPTRRTQLPSRGYQKGRSRSSWEDGTKMRCSGVTTREGRVHH
ncbi:hypothetical protein MLD38_009173 [Melastoma candidum]|uniref:Uncharacterized protein n=1 Tax=Melastoma candidum TaxID=119954 RepID=A0ACB9RWD0_9MYRT|nr:hypothetical protein MLD38_009173 [Melastoma candidum]